jgi:AFG3 family protein
MLRNFHKWLNVPKGFGKFYPKGLRGKGSDKSAGAGRAGGGGTGGGAGKGGGGGGNKPDFPGGFPEGPWRNLSFGVLLTLTAGSLLMANDGSKPGREISWQDFQTQLLESGMVDRIIITNKNTAKVQLRTVEGMEGATGGTLNITAGDGASNGERGSGGPQTLPSASSFEEKFTGNFKTVGGTSASNSGSSSNSSNGENHSDEEGEEGAKQPQGSPAKYVRYPRLGNPNTNTFAPYFFQIGSVESFERKLEEAQRSLGIQPRDFIPVMYVNETSWTTEAMRFGPTLALIAAYFFITRGAGGGMMGGGGNNVFKIGKSTAKKVNKETVTTTFAEVAGCDQAKEEIMEFIEFLKTPKRFSDLGAKIPKGALLCGPPGTGKTLLAKATAGEANVPFYSISGSDFVEMFVGVGPSRVRDLFKEARENAPCIVFIDEIDAVGRQRGKGGFSGSNDERENTLNQLLVEMDGFDTSHNVVILAGTNRVDILDSALTRPGRFDRQITVDKPDIKGRKEIFEVHLKGLNLDSPPDEFSSRLAALTPGFVGADIANMCNEAAIIAARRGKTQIQLDDFEKATDRLVGGLESNKIMSPEERKVVAYHEAGHAVAGWNLEHADPLLKVTIVPRGSGALGYAQYLPKEIFLRTREQILDIVCMALAGRAAEQVTFGNVTTGAADDLRRVTQIVYQMVQVYGMNENIGQVSFPQQEGGGFPQDRMYSNATAEAMDNEVRAIVEEAYQRTLDLMKEKKEQVTAVAELLLEKETITNVDVTNLIGARPYSAGKEYEEYANAGWVQEDKDAATAAKVAAEAQVVEEGEEGEEGGGDGEAEIGPLTPGFAVKP